MLVSASLWIVFGQFCGSKFMHWGDPGADFGTAGSTASPKPCVGLGYLAALETALFSPDALEKAVGFMAKFPSFPGCGVGFRHSNNGGGPEVSWFTGSIRRGHTVECLWNPVNRLDFWLRMGNGHMKLFLERRILVFVGFGFCFSKIAIMM